MNAHIHQPEAGAVRKSRCVTCRKVIVRITNDSPWKVKPQGMS